MPSGKWNNEPSRSAAVTTIYFGIVLADGRAAAQVRWPQAEPVKNIGFMLPGSGVASRGQQTTLGSLEKQVNGQPARLCCGCVAG